MKIQKQMAIREQKARRRNLTKYIPNAAAAIFTVRRISLEFESCSVLPEL